MKNKYFAIGLVTLAIAATGFSYFAQPASAYSEIGEVTTNTDEVRTKVSMKAEIVEIDGSMVKLKDSETGVEYTTRFGPSWFVEKEYKVGDQVELTGVLVDAEDNDNGNTLSTMIVDGKTLRSNFPGKPDWAGKGGNGGNGNGAGNGNGGECVND